MRRRTGQLDAAAVTEPRHGPTGRSARRLTEIDLCLTRGCQVAGRRGSPGAQAGDRPRRCTPEEAALGARQGAIRSWCADAELVIDTEQATTLARADGAQREVAAIAGPDRAADAGGAEAIAALRAGRARRARGDRPGTRRRRSRPSGGSQSRRQMEEQIAEDRRRSAVLGSLAQDLRQDRFGEYIVQETLGMLAAHASEELLRISDGRYSLAAGRGRLRSGRPRQRGRAAKRAHAQRWRDVPRQPRARARALASHRRARERRARAPSSRRCSSTRGSATLDPATLEEVIEALERLRADELVVGVISHVPELADRIKVGLEVRTEGGAAGSS